MQTGCGQRFDILNNMLTDPPASASTRRVPLYKFLSPRYWPTWIFLGLLRLAVLLPFSWIIKLGAGLGRIMYWVLRQKKAIALTNLRLCFPNQSPTDRNTLVKKHFRSLGIGVFEMGLCWWALDRHVLGRCRIEGLEHLTNLMAQNVPIIMLTAHFTTIEIAGSVVNRHLPIGAVFREQKNRLFSQMIVRGRERNTRVLIHRDNIREMLRALKKRFAVWYAPDQHYAGKQFMFVPFFDIPAATTTATARLVKLTGARIVPLFQVRRLDDQGYDIIVLPPMEAFHSDDLLVSTTAISQQIEAMVRRAPDQYLWVHRRFKKQPDARSIYL